jgi:hypothetical protein
MYPTRMYICTYAWIGLHIRPINNTCTLSTVEHLHMYIVDRRFYLRKIDPGKFHYTLAFLPTCKILTYPLLSILDQNALPRIAVSKNFLRNT